MRALWKHCQGDIVIEGPSLKHSHGSILMEASSLKHPEGSNPELPQNNFVRVCLAPPVRGGVGQRRQGQGCQGVGLVPIVSEQVRVWKVRQTSVEVS